MIIKFLPELTIKKISAGEFLNNPSCILKELIENSIDAGSKYIKIEICNNGLDLIKITDDGIGMDKNDLFISSDSYTTSKIFFFNDLLNLNSFGFRGEALSCISSISNFSISSKFKYSSKNHGWLLFTKYSKLKKKKIIKPIHHNFGTIVNVKNLFFNFPVRRKELFLSYYNQFFLIKKIINYFVISNFKINFLFYKDNNLYREYINKFLKDENNILDRIRNIYGEKFCQEYKYISIKDKYVSFNGYLFLNNNFKNIKIIFLNNRIISTKNLLYSVVNNFFINFLNKKKYFSYILFFKIKSKYININISPNKKKINFLNSYLIFNKIYSNLSLFFNKKSKINIVNKKKKISKIFFSNKNFLDNYLYYFLINFGNIINIFNNRFVFSVKRNSLLIISDLLYIFYYINILIVKKKYFFLIENKKIKKIKIFLVNKFFLNIERILYILNILGIKIYYKNKYFLVTYVPIEFLNLNLKKFFLSFFLFLKKIEKSKFIFKIIIFWLSNYIILNGKLTNYNVMNLMYKFHSCIKKFKYKFKKKIFYFLNLNKLYLYYFNDLWL